MPVSVARAPASTRTSQPPPPAAQGDGCASVWARAEDKLCFGSFFCPEPEIWPMLAGHAAAPSLGPPARQLGSTAGGLAALKTGRERPPGARVGSSQPSHGTPRCPRPQGLCCPLRQGERGRGRDQRGALGWVRWGGEGPGLLTFVADVFVALFPPQFQKCNLTFLPPASSCGTGAVLAGGSPRQRWLRRFGGLLLPSRAPRPPAPRPSWLRLPLLVVSPSGGASVQGFPRAAHAAPGRKAGVFPRTSPGPRRAPLRRHAFTADLNFAQHGRASAPPRVPTLSLVCVGAEAVPPCRLLLCKLARTRRTGAAGDGDGRVGGRPVPRALGQKLPV